MSAVLRGVIALVASFALSVLSAPTVIKAASKLKAGQPILRYVEEHAVKAGTPTMGGWIFILPTILVTLAFTRGLGAGRVAVITTSAYAVIGFLDDFLKIKRKDNGGLKPYQKIISQLGVAAILCWYVWRTPSISTVVYIPFYKAVDIGYWILPLTAFVYIAGTNAVNLTDGLDGLAGNTTVVYCLGATALFVLVAVAEGDSGRNLDELSVFALALTGALEGFLLYNTSPAKVFMGDTGSMALGGAVCSLAVFSRLTFYLPVIGIMYVVSCITVIVQVGYFKLSKGKRVFLMAPLHHHLQRKGMSEAKISALYVALTLLGAAIAVAGVYLGYYGVDG
ncbi:MAG: phospho-N-acetylmuramoyl-pentapeptide-transferase [Clostridia bacterium]|nr:phospho-N-acetylmuramoyl-pentapeptide-transferase [Clostridia bacterium]